jgi:hypothetical protein
LKSQHIYSWRGSNSWAFRAACSENGLRDGTGYNKGTESYSALWPWDAPTRNMGHHGMKAFDEESVLIVTISFKYVYSSHIHFFT